jgi:hypothetical protein
MVSRDLQKAGILQYRHITIELKSKIEGITGFVENNALKRPKTIPLRPYS